MTDENERLIRIGRWAEENRDAIVSALLTVRWGIDEVSYLDIEEQKEIQEGAVKALASTIWSKE